MLGKMKNILLKKLPILMMVIAILLTCSACDSSNQFKKDIHTAFEAKNVAQCKELFQGNRYEKYREDARAEIVNLVSSELYNHFSYENLEFFASISESELPQELKQSIDDIMYDSVKKAMEQSKDYNDFIQINSIATKHHIKKLEELVNENGTNMLKAVLTGKWQRSEDGTPLAGAVIELSFSDTAGRGILREVSPNGIWFVNDLKWKNIEIYNKEEFTYEDLGKYSDGTASGYFTATGKMDYDSMTLTLHISDASDYGQDQIWKKIE